jgi:hypothetical protein
LQPTSWLELKWSLSPGWKGGPFKSMPDLLVVLLVCLTVGPSPIGLTECSDQSQENRNEQFRLFQTIDDLQVPTHFDWVTILHRDVVERMKVNLRTAAQVDGVRTGTQGDYLWVTLCDEPYSASAGVGVAAYVEVPKRLGLAGIQRRFRRNS